MSDYVATKCIRLETEHQDLEKILNYLGKNELYKNIKEDEGYLDLYEINEILEEKENIRIIKYKSNYYIDIILQNEYGETEIELYLSIKEINNIVDDFIDKYGYIKIINIIVLAFNWYNGSDEPYSY